MIQAGDIVSVGAQSSLILQLNIGNALDVVVEDSGGSGQQGKYSISEVLLSSSVTRYSVVQSSFL